MSLVGDYYDTDVGPGGETVATAVSRSAGTGLNNSERPEDSAGRVESGASSKALLAGTAAVAGLLYVGGGS